MLTHPGILERVIDPQRGDFPEDLARRVLSFDFPPADHVRYEELSAKAQEGALSDEERAELEDYLNVNDFLMILRAKAQASLRTHGSAA
jgi:hypothetical protein